MPNLSTNHAIHQNVGSSVIGKNSPRPVVSAHNLKTSGENMQGTQGIYLGSWFSAEHV
jgi:hypothetical protein